MKFQDYYQILGVTRSSTKEEISKAYKKLARKYHPDLNKEKNAEDQFKKIAEAYEVLKDPEKRKLYNELGENWKSGQDFKPPPGWEDLFSQAFKSSSGGPSASSSSGQQFRGSRTKFTGRPEGFSSEGGAGFSDFFQALFGGSPDFNNKGFSSQGFNNQGFTENKGTTSGGTNNTKSSPKPIEVYVSIDEILNQVKKTIRLNITKTNPFGGKETSTKNLTFKIPDSMSDGKLIKIKGNKNENNPEIVLKLKISPDQKSKIDGNNVISFLYLTPGEAAIGGKFEITVFSSTYNLNIPGNTSSGKTFRLKNKGLPLKDGTRGDLLLEVKIVLPEKLSEEEIELYKKLSEISNFNPRSI